MIMEKFKNIKIIAFDADDTLWDCQSYFDKVSDRLAEMLLPWSTKEDSERRLYETERRNISSTGFGCKAFTLSVLETAINVSNGEISANEIGELIHLGYSLLNIPATPLPGVEVTLSKMSKFYKVVFTKGDLLNQQQKLSRSGLADFFQHVEITADKTEKDFYNLCRKMQISPSELLMVGNSFKSDIAPAINIGANAIHIPFHVEWQLEHRTEFTHPNLVRINHFNEILNYI